MNVQRLIGARLSHRVPLEIYCQMGKFINLAPAMLAVQSRSRASWRDLVPFVTISKASMPRGGEASHVRENGCLPLNSP